MTAAMLEDLLSFALDLADAAAVETLRQFRTPLDIANKAGADAAYDPVTEADKAAEEAIRRLIERRFPDHGIHGEEFAVKDGSSAFAWSIDPIDGTRSYMIGAPMWGTLIGLTHEGEAVLGLMDQPFTGERWIGVPGLALAELRRGTARTPLRCRPTAALADATLSSTHPTMFKTASEIAAYDRLMDSVKLHRYGGDCYAYGLVALGHHDLVVEAGLKPFDVIALEPILRAAGGVLTNWEGGSALRGGRAIAAATPELHASAVAILSRS